MRQVWMSLQKFHVKSGLSAPLFAAEDAAAEAENERKPALSLSLSLSLSR